MAQRIKIWINNSLNKLQRVSILRKTLKQFIKTDFVTEPGNKQIWERPTVRKKILEQIRKKKPTFRPTIKRGRTELTERKFVRYEFKLNRKVLRDDEDVAVLMKNIRKRFKTVEKKNKQLETQRLMVAFGTDEVEQRTIKNFKTKRKNEVEATATISTVTYEREKASTEGMLLELEDKIKSIFMKETLKYQHLGKGDDNLMEALALFVMFASF